MTSYFIGLVRYIVLPILTEHLSSIMQIIWNKYWTAFSDSKLHRYKEPERELQEVQFAILFLAWKDIAGVVNLSLSYLVD